MYEKALVPIDGSEFSRQALQHVIRLAPREVVLFAAIESVSSALARQTGVVSDVPPEVAEQVLTAETRDLRRHLRAAADELAERGWNGPTLQLVLQGKPGQKIVELAHDLACDIIVMATHGRTGIRRVLVGSVADYVLSHVTGAVVLLVRP